MDQKQVKPQTFIKKLQEAEKQAFLIKHASGGNECQFLCWTLRDLFKSVDRSNELIKEVKRSLEMVQDIITRDGMHLGDRGQLGGYPILLEMALTEVRLHLSTLRGVVQFHKIDPKHTDLIEALEALPIGFEG